jgi:hypothetical protein
VERDGLRGLVGVRSESNKQSGTFRILNGSVVDPTLAEKAQEATEKADGITQKVIFHTGDGSIDGSLCVGFDCTSSESFGFDTLRLKENNLRLKLRTTCASSSKTRRPRRASPAATGS